jgi:hypothetical protein
MWVMGLPDSSTQMALEALVLIPATFIDWTSMVQTL